MYRIAITVQLSKTAIKALRGNGDAKLAQRLIEIAKQAGTHWVPIHPSTHDTLLASYFTLEIDDFEAAKQPLKQLRLIPEILAIYVKPSDEIP